VKARRRLRRLGPDPELIRRRATGEPLRQLAGDYGVAHTTVGRYFARPQVKTELAQARRQLRAEQAARTSAWQRLEPAVRRRANEQAARERQEHKRFQLAWAEHRPRWRPPRDQYETLLNEHDAPRRPPTRADQHNTFDVIAERVVAAGGGTQAVIDANELRILEQLVDLIDPAILTQAFANDALQLPQPPLAPKPRPRPRRLIPDAALIRRRAAGEPLRQLAHDYQVNHTTLSRYFARTEIKRQLQHTRRQLRAQQRAHKAGRRPPNRRPTTTTPHNPATDRPPKHAHRAHPASCRLSAKTRHPRPTHPGRMHERGKELSSLCEP
jgi:hypothetical protein